MHLNVADIRIVNAQPEALEANSVVGTRIANGHMVTGAWRREEHVPNWMNLGSIGRRVRGAGVKHSVSAMS